MPALALGPVIAAAITPAMTGALGVAVGGIAAGVIGGAINGLVIGAVVGGVGAAISGGNIGKGILHGAVGGLIAGGILGGIGVATGTMGYAKAGTTVAPSVAPVSQAPANIAPEGIKLEGVAAGDFSGVAPAQVGTPSNSMLSTAPVTGGTVSPDMSALIKANQGLMYQQMGGAFVTEGLKGMLEPSPKETYKAQASAQRDLEKEREDRQLERLEDIGQSRLALSTGSAGNRPINTTRLQDVTIEDKKYV